jgi:DNA-binding transcriptional MocR family regulator
MAYEIPLFDGRAETKPMRNTAYKLAHYLGRIANQDTHVYQLRLTAVETCSELGCSRATVERAYYTLRDLGWIKHCGRKDNGVWGKLGEVYGFRNTKPAQKFKGKAKDESKPAAPRRALVEDD